MSQLPWHAIGGGWGRNCEQAYEKVDERRSDGEDPTIENRGEHRGEQLKKE